MNIKLILLLLVFCSCSIKKEATKIKTDFENKKDYLSEEFRTITERFEGEEMQTDILPLSERKRDALGNLKDFFETKREGNLKKTIHYKTNGEVTVSVKQMDLTRIIQESIKTEDKGVIKESKTQKESKKEESTKTGVFLWCAIGLLFFWQAIKEFKKK